MDKKLLLAAFIFSGMAALIYEIVWIRPLQYILGSTVYTISIIFSAFMAGLALGSWIVSKYIHRIENLPKMYALIEIIIGLYGILLLIVFNFLPSLYRNFVFPLHPNFYEFEAAKFLLTFLAILVPTTLMGATFPILAKFYTTKKIGKGIGELYSANNIGAILGSFAAGFILIPIFGIKAAVIFAGTVNLAIASFILIYASKELAKKIIPLSFIIFILFSAFSSYSIKNLYINGFGRAFYSEDEIRQTEILFYKEGLHATINVVREGDAKAFLINGFGQGSTAFQDARVNMLLVYLPLLINPGSENALLIGLGTGITSGHLSQFVGTTTVEIEPVVIEAAEYFKDENFNVLESPSHNLVIDDARNYLLRNKKKYDIIISEPTNTWQSFSTALFSKEFYSLVKSRLTENGLYVQWIPIYDFTKEDFRSFYKTFDSEFPYIIAFENFRRDEVGFSGTEIIFIGSQNPIRHESIVENFNLIPDFARVQLSEILIKTPKDITNLILFTSDQMKGYANSSPMVTDDNALLEFSTASHTLYASSEETLNDVRSFLSSDFSRTD